MLGELLLSAYLAFSSPSNPDSLNIAKNPLPLQYSETLKVNTENTVRYVSFRSEDDGLSDMRVMADTSEFEESFLFDPKKDEWMETGLVATGWTDDSFHPNIVYLDMKYINDKIDSLDELRSYHFHPVKGHPQTLNYSFAPGLEGIIDLYNKIFAYTTAVIPSIDDVNIMIYEESLFYKKHPNGVMKHKVVSHLGVTEYFLTEEAIKHVKNDLIIIFVSSKDYSILSKFLKPQIESFFSDDFENVEEFCIDKIKEVLSLRRNDYIEIKFIPFKDFE